MTRFPGRKLPSAAEILAAAPGVAPLTGARARIRAVNARTGRRIAVLDDDPTGSQAVHGVSVVTVLEPAEYAAALADPGSTCFILTNSRSLPEAAAAAVTLDAGRALFELGRHLQAPVTVVSRGDSTLRGHVISEVQALEQARRDVLGRGFDGVLFVPGYFEAGRFTAGNVHWARVGQDLVPVGETEYARDATFGYRSSDLRDFLVEQGVGPARVHALTLHDIRIGGPSRVAEVLIGLTGGDFLVVNATGYADLEIVVLGLHDAEAGGASFLHRSGPSFVRALAGVEPQAPLTAEQIWPAGAPRGHGLVVVGSHVASTSRQVAVARARGTLAEVELVVSTLIEGGDRDARVRELTERVTATLAHADVLLFTSRTLVTGADGSTSQEIARAVSAALTDVVRGAMRARPAWVVGKGGTTSHDVAVHGLGIRRAVVLGQLLPGQISVFQPVAAAAGAGGIPYVVFPGNVGGESALADVVDLLRTGGATDRAGQGG